MFNYEVVICTYNGERYIVEQLSSIVGQSVPPKRIIVSDDGSTDDTLLLIDRFATTTSIQIDVRQRTIGPKGPAHNFLHALSLTIAPYVFLSDQDDVWITQKVEHYLQVVSEITDDNQPILVFSDARVVDDELKLLHPSFLKNERLDPTRQLEFQQLTFQNCVQGATVMVNRALLGRVKTSTHVLMHDWWLGLVAAAFGQLIYIPHPLIQYRQHGNNAVGSLGYGMKHIFAKLARLSEIAQQNRLIIDQAEFFYELYRDNLKKEDKDFLVEMSKSRRFGLWQIFLCKFSIKRTTLMRTVSLYFLY